MSVRRIAKLAGLSPSAVSLALRDSPKVSLATRRRVRLLAERIGYAPNAQIAELMSHVRGVRDGQSGDCFGVISLYDHPKPWEKDEHLTRIYRSMRTRALELGCRLEPLWLRAPGMTYRRFRSVLDARKIQGLICFGSALLNDRFPEELDHYAVVTVGLSIETPLHRITSHFYNDTQQALNKVHQRGYRRPGLILSSHSDVRSAHTHSSAYLGWCDRVLKETEPIPVLRIDRVDDRKLIPWFERYSPDAVVFVHAHQALEDFDRFLRDQKISLPNDLGVAAVTHYLEGTRFAGMQQNQLLIGSWAVELLVARVMHRDFGIPANPRIEMVESCWTDGPSLRDTKSI